MYANPTSSPKFLGQNIVGLEYIWFFRSRFPLTIFYDSTIQMVSRILVHPILVDPKYHAVVSYALGIWEVSRSCLEGGVSGLDAGAWQRLGRGDQCFYHKWARWVWLGAERRHGAIFLVVFGWVGLIIGKLWNFDLISVGEEHRWSDNGVDLL